MEILTVIAIAEALIIIILLYKNQIAAEVELTEAEIEKISAKIKATIVADLLVAKKDGLDAKAFVESVMNQAVKAVNVVESQAKADVSKAEANAKIVNNALNEIKESK
jgi:hypothetical protein